MELYDFFKHSDHTVNHNVSLFDLITMTRSGISKKSASDLAHTLGISQSGLISIMHLSIRTWQRYSDEKKLPKEASERAIQIASLYARGEQVFGNLDNFKGWMNHPSPVLSGNKPIDLLDTAFGFQAVLDELIRIEYGVLA